MSGLVVVDTSIASFVLRRDTRQELYEHHFRNVLVVVPFQVAAELHYGARIDDWGPRRVKALDRYLSRHLVWGWDDMLSGAWVDVMGHARAIGRRLEPGDGWIAATAFALGAPLLTHDSDFGDLELPGLEVICYAR